MSKVRKISIVLLLTFMFLAGSLINGSLIKKSAAASAGEEMPQIIVTGYGSTSVSPDQAKISLGVLTIAATARDAQQENAARTNRIVNTLIDAGVPRDNIATQDYSVWPEYYYPESERNKTPSIVAYRVNNTILVTLDDIGKVGPVIDAAVAAGANQVQSIQFLKKDQSTAQREALQKACQEALQKAGVIAQSLGLQIVGVQSVQESSSIIQPFIYQKTGLLSGAGEASTPIEPGELQINASVTVVFRVK